MKTKINFLFVALFLLEIATAQTLVEHQQDWIDQPANISIGNFDSFINASIANEGMAKINVIDPSTQSVGYSPTDFWPQGTWLHGYYERGDFWSDGFGTNCPQDNYGYPSGHPLFRINDKMLRSLIHSNHANPGASWVADNIQTIKDGMDYIISHQWLISVPPAYMDDYGGFTWWATRSGETEIDDESPFSNRPHAYETSHVLRAMCEAYMYFQDNNISYSNMTGLYQAILNAADNLERKTLAHFVQKPGGFMDFIDDDCDISNSNFKGLALWALAAAYKVAYYNGDFTDATKYYNKVKAISTRLTELQTTDGSLQDGMWLTGGTYKEYDDCGRPLFHDTRIYYHCIILRGLVEMMDITLDSDVAWKIYLIAIGCFKTPKNFISMPTGLKTG